MTTISNELAIVLNKLNDQIYHVTNELNKLQKRVNDPVIVSHSLPKSLEQLIAAKTEEYLAEQNRLLNEQLKQSQKQLAVLENQTVPRLQKKIEELEKQVSHLQTVSAAQPLVFQEFSIERVYLDKYEQTTNLGQLGIRELTGKLHIGAVHAADPADGPSEKQEAKDGQSQEEPEKPEDGD